MKGPATWAWQEPYDAVLLERDPSKLPERLVMAEKAILQRIQEFPDSMNELPEGRALREALDCLYALCPQEHHAPGQIADEESYRTAQRNWMRFAAPVGLVLILSLATGWVVARKNARNDPQGIGDFEETNLLVNSRTGIMGDPADHPAAEARSHQYDFKTRPAPEAFAAKGRDAPLQNAPSQESVDDSATRTSANPAIQPEQEGQSTPPPAIEAQKKSDAPRGSVSVSSSTYPSIRVPPELAAPSAESFQIGESISRTDPIDPDEAERQGIEGTVKLHAIVGKDGAVQDVEVLSGPSLLSPAAASAVRQWRYEPTLLGDQPIEVGEDVTIVFRLANTTAN
ncbi:MAG: hypothetical protein DMG32_18240 [Acidobacteria bacterium]|nr:MAG: hypothetical protein DMG32_18240 [Acidobacteriota bacterium]